MKFNFTKGKNKSTALAIRMAISLALALIVGTAFILLREYLLANDKGLIWNSINSILFQDITTEEGKEFFRYFLHTGPIVY